MTRTFYKVVVALLLVVGVNASVHTQLQAEENIQMGQHLYLPTIRTVYDLPAPQIASVDNNDHDTLYSVTWVQPAYDPIDNAFQVPKYILEESTNPNFINATIVHENDGQTIWSTPHNTRRPGTYYYRARGTYAGWESKWSNIQSVTIFPMHVGLQVRWDGVGYFDSRTRTEEIGWHQTMFVDAVTDTDTVRAKLLTWYDPDPGDFGQTRTDLFYSPTSGRLKASSAPPNPQFLWGASLLVPYDGEFTDGQIVQVGGQPFLVKGPLTGYTTFGRQIAYWELTNTQKFMYYNSVSSQQFVEVGNAVLRYEAGNTRLRLYKSVRRNYYRDGRPTGETIHYIDHLTAANVLNGSPAVQPLPSGISLSTSEMPSAPELNEMGNWSMLSR